MNFGRVSDPCPDCVDEHCTMNCSGVTIIDERMQTRVENAFRPLDALVCALAPDAPKPLIDAWESIMDYLGPDFAARRSKRLGLNTDS